MNLESLVLSIKSKTMLTVIGDLMLDVFVAGEVERISPEAPVPILIEKSTLATPGGAANAALRAADLEAITMVLGRVGDDDAGQALEALLEASRVSARALFIDSQISTTKKTRFLAASGQMLRVDNDGLGPTSAREVAFYREKLKGSRGIVLVSDYGKGVVSDEVLECVREHCKEIEKPFIVDPANGVDPARYRDAALLTPNRSECEKLTGVEIVDTESAERAAQEYSDAAGGLAVLVTLGADGSLLLVPGASTVVLPAHRRDVFDVTGAGDATAAAIARGLGGGLDLPAACRLGMAAGAVAVSCPHTASMTLYELTLL